MYCIHKLIVLLQSSVLQLSSFFTTGHMIDKLIIYSVRWSIHDIFVVRYLWILSSLFKVLKHKTLEFLATGPFLLGGGGGQKFL